MKAKRLLIALLFAVLVSGLFTFWLSRRVAKAARVNVPQKQRYVAAGKALDAGELLKPGSLQLVEWAAPAPLTGGFTKIEDVATLDTLDEFLRRLDGLVRDQVLRTRALQRGIRDVTSALAILPASEGKPLAV